MNTLILILLIICYAILWFIALLLGSYLLSINDDGGSRLKKIIKILFLLLAIVFIFYLLSLTDTAIERYSGSHVYDFLLRW